MQWKRARSPKATATAGGTGGQSDPALTSGPAALVFRSPAPLDLDWDAARLETSFIVRAGQRLPFTLSTRWFNLTPGTYEVGLCGWTTTAGEGAKWNSNEWSRVTAILAQQ